MKLDYIDKKDKQHSGLSIEINSQYYRFLLTLHWVEEIGGTRQSLHDELPPDRHH